MFMRGSTGVAHRLLPHRRVRTRRYLRAGLSLEGFFDELNRRGASYAVLRWFESLPEVEPGEDIDILVADEDMALVGTMLTSHLVAPSRQKFDVYSVSGLPGSDYRGIPYLRPRSRPGCWTVRSCSGTGTGCPARSTTSIRWPITRPTTRASAPACPRTPTQRRRR
ncbi:hypothetical protein A7K94_0201095 [Modestobacter sp. VKM Ac-2676]|nr:hypothetical protein A7K94_0201095 [Modestobacter sp. VKM Ac-2676]